MNARPDAELREPTVLILTALASGRKHGYAILKEAEELSSGRVTMRVGTLYAALDRLSEQGLVERDGDEAVDGRLRRYFRLSDAGAAVLEAEADRLEATAQAARKGLRVRGGAQPAGGTA